MAARCYYLDWAKVMTTFLVIFGHLHAEDSTVRLYLYAFHMPLFFIISGIFHQFTGKINWKKYCKSILWPALIFIILMILVGRLCRYHGLRYYLTFYFIDIPLGKHESFMWFLFALFWVKCFTDFILRVNRPVVTTLLWMVLLFIPILLKKRLPFMMLQGLMALPFYLFGYHFRDILRNRQPSAFYLLPAAVCLILTILVTRLHGRVSMLGLHFGQLASLHGIDLAAQSRPIKLLVLGGDAFLFYLNGLIGSAMVFSLALLPVPKMSFVTPLSMSLITVVGTQYLLVTPIVRHFGYNLPFLICVFLSIGIFALCYCFHSVLRPVYRLIK